MDKEMFKELHAHIRACDQKSLVMNAGYLATLLFFYSSRGGSISAGKPETGFLGSNFSQDMMFFLSVVAIGYGVLFVQLLFRGWKVHYMHLLHEVWDENKEELKFSPVWMKIPPVVNSFDNIFRLIPAFTNVIAIIQISYTYDNSFKSVFWTFLVLLILIHLAIVALALRFGQAVVHRRA